MGIEHCFLEANKNLLSRELQVLLRNLEHCTEGNFLKIEPAIVEILTSRCAAAVLLATKNYCGRLKELLQDSPDSHKIRSSELVDQVSALAEQHSNNLITSVHVLRVIMEIDKEFCARALESLNVEFRAKHPSGTPSLKRARDFAVKMNEPHWVERFDRSIAEIGFGLLVKKEQLDGYLSSRYFPFGPNEYVEFSKHKGDYHNSLAYFYATQESESASTGSGKKSIHTLGVLWRKIRGMLR